MLRLGKVVTVLSLLVVLASASDATAQGRRGRGGGGGGFGRGGGFGQGFGDTNKLQELNRPDVQKELEIVEDQQQKIREIQRGLGEKMREAFSGFRDLRDASDEERQAAFEEMRKKGEEVTASIEKEVDEVLLPGQRDRLNQIVLQRRLQGRGGAVRALTSTDVSKALGLTDDQKKKLEEVGQEAQKELEEKIRKVREEAQEKILGVLTAEQKEIYKKLHGERFEPSRDEN
jgi:Spy/CpxP family protein refolding chaperone